MRHWAYSSEKVRPGLAGNCVIHKDFYEHGLYIAHNRDIRYSPHSVLTGDRGIEHTCIGFVLLCCNTAV